MARWRSLSVAARERALPQPAQKVALGWMGWPHAVQNLRAGLPGVAGVHSHTRQPDSRLARNCNDDRGGGLFVCRGRAAHRACGGALTLAAAALEAVVDHHVATDGVGTSAIGSAASSREVIPGRVCWSGLLACLLDVCRGSDHSMGSILLRRKVRHSPRSKRSAPSASYATR